MSSPSRVLPTLANLGVTSIPTDVDAKSIAADWFKRFSVAVTAGSIDEQTISDLFVQDACFRDILALTWHFRTFEGIDEIERFFRECVAKISFEESSFVLDDASFQQPFPDIAWIQGLFRFSTDVGIASGVFRLVPTGSERALVWKAHHVFTHLEELKGFPEKIGALRDNLPNHGKWAQKRTAEVAFANEDPAVLILGGGQSGLDIAARLKTLEVSALVIEQTPRIGDQWRNRYEALCLHDVVWYDHMPYLPFPSTWPVYTPALKLADWLEAYAHALELNVWTSSTVISASQDAGTKKWKVTVQRTTGDERTFIVNHLVLAAGLTAGGPFVPQIHGQDSFQGTAIHSTKYQKARDYEGKKVIVVGAATSGHDIAADLHGHGVDVTMVQRSPTYIMTTKSSATFFGPLYSENGPPTDLADKFGASFPRSMLILLQKRTTKLLAEMDKDILDKLNKVGFKTYLGPEDAGPLVLVFQRGGGYYLDVGTSALIANGDIKLKNDSEISQFTKNGLKFANDSELQADVVVFATGYGDMKNIVRKICGDDVADRCPPIWGLDKEGEVNGAWRDLGVPGLWVMLGNLQMSRFHSKHLALQIKAIEEKVIGAVYKLSA